MALLLGILFVSGCVFATRHAVTHLRDDYSQSKARALKQAGPKAAGGSRKRAALRQHRVAWWARETRHGFPVTRAGLHTGWLAHQTALAQTSAKREEARTSHLDAQASILEGLREHRKRQEEALQRILAAQEDPEPVVATGGPPPSPEGRQHMTEPFGNPSHWNGGGAYAGTEGTYSDVKGGAAAHASHAELAHAEYQQQLTAAQARLEGMEAAGVDQATLADQADLVERLRAAVSAIAMVEDQAPAVGAGLQQRHGGLKEAHDDAPVRAAERQFYEE